MNHIIPKVWTVAGSNRFRKAERINDPQDFRRVMKTGKKIISRSFIFFTRENTKGFNRLGVVVSKEVGPATYRNRIKRICREFFRLNKHQIKESVDIVVLTKKGCGIRNYNDATVELRRILSL